VSGRRKHYVLDDSGKAKLSYALPCYDVTISADRLGPRTLSKALLSLVAPSLLSPLSSRSEDRQVFNSVDHLGLWVKTANSLYTQVKGSYRPFSRVWSRVLPSFGVEQLLAGADYYSVHREVNALCPERTPPLSCLLAERLLPTIAQRRMAVSAIWLGRSGICVQRTVPVAFFYGINKPQIQLAHQSVSCTPRSTIFASACSSRHVRTRSYLVLSIRQSRMIEAECKGRAMGERCKEVDLYSAEQQRNEAVSKRMESPFNCSASDQ